MAYLDNVIVLSRDFRSHLDNLEQVSDRLWDVNLKLQPDKCKLMFREVKYLGYKILEKGTEPLTEKTHVVRTFKTSSNAKEIKQFLGSTGYFRDFIPRYSEISTPLTALLCKNVTFEWTAKCKGAFQMLKQKLITAPVLAFPGYNLPFKLHTDDSTKALGYVLMEI